MGFKEVKLIYVCFLDEIHFMNVCEIAGWVANSVDPDQTLPLSPAFDLCLKGPFFWTRWIRTVIWSNRIPKKSSWTRPGLPFMHMIRSQRAHDVHTTSAQRRCNVMTLHRRWGDVVITSCARWGSLYFEFARIIINLPLHIWCCNCG